MPSELRYDSRALSLRHVVGRLSYGVGIGVSAFPSQLKPLPDDARSNYNKGKNPIYEEKTVAAKVIVIILDLFYYRHIYSSNNCYNH